MISVISDVHGKFDEYLELTKQYEYTVQLGDMGFDYSSLKGLSDNHKFFGGNHDNYDKYYECKYALGDYGYEILNDINFFYIRGAFSIDKKYRVDKVSWFKEEQLNYKQRLKAFDKYNEIKPELMVTHSCPKSIANIIGEDDILIRFGFNPRTFNTQTQDLLQMCFDFHKPKIWVFGHFHKDFMLKFHGTLFICKEELGVTSISKDLEIIV